MTQSYLTSFLTGKDPLGDARLKMRRAGEHLHALEAAMQYFLDIQGTGVTKKFNEKTNMYRYVVEPPAMPPRHFSLIVGDIVHSLRSALDHVAYQLALIKTAPKRPSRSTIWPIITVDDWEGRRRFKKATAQMPTAVRDWLWAIQPHHGGDDSLYHKLAILNALSNTDKHRLITITAAELEIRLPPEGKGGSHEVLHDQTMIVDIPADLHPEVNFEPYVTRSIAFGGDEGLPIAGHPLDTLLWDIHNNIRDSAFPLATGFVTRPQDLNKRWVEPLPKPERPSKGAHLERTRALG